MRRILPLLLVVLVGCRGNPDQQPLMKLLNDLEAATGAPFDDEVKKYENTPERSVRTLAWLNRNHLDAVDRFLAGNPRLTAKARERVDALRALYAEIDAHYAGRIAAKRYEPSDEDRAKEQWFMGEVLERMMPLGRMADGDE
jgi:hypothetical protein